MQLTNIIRLTKLAHDCFFTWSQLTWQQELAKSLLLIHISPGRACLDSNHVYRNSKVAALPFCTALSWILIVCLASFWHLEAGLITDRWSGALKRGISCVFFLLKHKWAKLMDESMCAKSLVDEAIIFRMKNNNLGSHDFMHSEGRKKGGWTWYVDGGQCVVELNRWGDFFISHLCWVISFRCYRSLAVITIQIDHFWWQTHVSFI